MCLSRLQEENKMWTQFLVYVETNQFPMTMLRNHHRTSILSNRNTSHDSGCRNPEMGLTRLTFKVSTDTYMFLGALRRIHFPDFDSDRASGISWLIAPPYSKLAMGLETEFLLFLLRTQIQFTAPRQQLQRMTLSSWPQQALCVQDAQTFVQVQHPYIQDKNKQTFLKNKMEN